MSATVGSSDLEAADLTTHEIGARICRKGHRIQGAILGLVDRSEISIRKTQDGGSVVRKYRSGSC